MKNVTFCMYLNIYRNQQKSHKLYTGKMWTMCITIKLFKHFIIINSMKCLKYKAFTNFKYII